jgi:ppGpp synthetase/RelA/SpoT-type nucleotidyltranferase
MNNDFLSNSITTLTLLLQIFSKLKDCALREFSSSYSFITDRSKWESLIQEKIRKDYNRSYKAIEDIIDDILIFFKCELTTRTFNHMREMTVNYFYS